jgi:hypothetical protein
MTIKVFPTMGRSLLIAVLLFYGILNSVFATDHGNSCSTATVVNIGTDTVGELHDNDSDFFSITVPSQGSLTVFTKGETDTYGRLLDSNEVLLEEDSNDGSGYNFLINRELEAGTYCLQVAGGSSSTNGIYSLRVEGDFSDDDHGTGCDSATTISDPRGTTLIGELSVYADGDYFLINTPSSGHITAYTNGEIDTYGKLFDADGILLQEDSNDGSGYNFLISQELEAGTYCLQVAGGRASTKGTYSLRVEGDFFDDDHGTNCKSATPINESSILGELSVYGDSDFFRFQIPENAGVVTLSTIGETDTYGKLFDANNIFLQEDSNDGSGYNFLIRGEMEAGIYCLQVAGGRASTMGIYTLVVEGDFIPLYTPPPSSSCSGQALYDAATGKLTIPAVKVGDDCFSVELRQQPSGFTFDLDLDSVTVVE